MKIVCCMSNFKKKNLTTKAQRHKEERLLHELTRILRVCETSSVGLQAPLPATIPKGIETVYD